MLIDMYDAVYECVVRDSITKVPAIRGCRCRFWSTSISKFHDVSR